MTSHKKLTRFLRGEPAASQPEKQPEKQTEGNNPIATGQVVLKAMQAADDKDRIELSLTNKMSFAKSELQEFQDGAADALADALRKTADKLEEMESQIIYDFIFPQIESLLREGSNEKKV